MSDRGLDSLIHRNSSPGSALQPQFNAEVRQGRSTDPGHEHEPQNLALTTPGRKGGRMSWQTSLGAWQAASGIRFRVWAPDAKEVQLVLERDGSPAFNLDKQGDGTFTGTNSS